MIESEERWGVDRRNDIGPDSNPCPPFGVKPECGRGYCLLACATVPPISHILGWSCTEQFEQSHQFSRSYINLEYSGHHASVRGSVSKIFIIFHFFHFRLSFTFPILLRLESVVKQVFRGR